MAAEGFSIEVASRVLGVSVCGYYEWRNRPPSVRALHQPWLTERIKQVFQASRGTYGARRVHAELKLGSGVAVGREAVARLMRRAGLQEISGRPRYQRVANVATAEDRVQRRFRREGRDRLWVTDITEHRTREGKAIARSSWTPLAGAWSVGRSTPTPARRSSRTRWAWPSSSVIQQKGRLSSIAIRGAVHVLGVHPAGH